MKARGRRCRGDARAAHFRRMRPQAGFLTCTSTQSYGAPPAPGETMVKDPNELLTYLLRQHHIVRLSITACWLIPADGLRGGPHRYLAYWDRPRRSSPCPITRTSRWAGTPARAPSSRTRIAVELPVHRGAGGHTPIASARRSRRRNALPPGRDRILTINAWNEDREQLPEPDTQHGISQPSGMCFGGEGWKLTGRTGRTADLGIEVLQLTYSFQLPAAYKPAISYAPIPILILIPHLVLYFPHD